MKSHDFHMWIEWILPTMVRGYVPEHVWLALSLSYFFHQLCAKELYRTVIADLERLTLMLLCKLEKIFPLGFFNPMQHLILHLPYEARMGGGVQGRRCYAIERCLKTIRKKCRKKCKIEASIAEAYILEEASNFTITYYGDKQPSVHNPPLVTMMAAMNRTSAYFEANSEAQVVRTLRPSHMKSGAISCYMY
jgi:hypothetical protein